MTAAVLDDATLHPGDACSGDDDGKVRISRPVPAQEADELEMRAKLLSRINTWLNKSALTQIDAAKRLGITQARVSEIKNGKINRFSLSILVGLAERAGLRPGIPFEKAA